MHHHGYLREYIDTYSTIEELQKHSNNYSAKEKKKFSNFVSFFMRACSHSEANWPLDTFPGEEQF